MGCFWSSEYIFNTLMPKLKTEVGYLKSEKGEIEVVKIYCKKEDFQEIINIFSEQHYWQKDESFYVPYNYSSCVFSDSKDTLNELKNLLENKMNLKISRTIILNSGNYLMADVKHQKRYLHDNFFCRPKINL